MVRRKQLLIFPDTAFRNWVRGEGAGNALLAELVLCLLSQLKVAGLARDGVCSADLLCVLLIPVQLLLYHLLLLP